MFFSFEAETSLGEGKLEISIISTFNIVVILIILMKL